MERDLDYRQEREPTAADNFRSMVRKIREAYDAPGFAQRRQARGEAVGLAASVLCAPEDERTQLRYAITRTQLLSPDLNRDIYNTLRAAKILNAIAVRQLLGFRPTGRLPFTRSGM